MPINPEFATNPDPRCACVLLLDTSGSMGGDPIGALNAGLQAFQDDLQEDPLARRRVEIAVVTFGGSVRTVHDFVSAAEFHAPHLTADGGTPMAAAIQQGVAMVDARKAEYKASGILYYQPWLFLITDGAPTDPQSDVADATSIVRERVAAKSLAFFAVGVGSGADMNLLSSMTDRALRLDGLKFRELFLWLSQSQRRVSGSKPGDQTPLPSIDFGSPL